MCGFHLRFFVHRYLYTALRESHDSGLGLLRPLYFEHPEEDMAYLQSLGMPQVRFLTFSPAREVLQPSHR
jgi:hypothetical protein